MRLSELSVRRPVFATVISLLLVILGLLAASRLPLRELPDVEPPIVSIETEYRGASADVVETKITQVIEDRVAGIEGVAKITSQSRATAARASTSSSRRSATSTPRRTTCATASSRVAGNLPEEADPPEIGKVDFDADPIIWLNLASDTLNVARADRLRRALLVDRLGVLRASRASA